MSFNHADDIFKTFFGGEDPFSMFFGDEGGGGRGFGGGGPRVVFRMGGPGGRGGGMGGDMGGMDGFPFGPGMMGGGGFPGGMGGGMGRKSGGQARPPPPPPHAMPCGTRIVVRGLEKAQEHNDKTGTIAGWDANKSRYEVELEKGETTLSLRPANLTQLCRAKLVGIESSPELNGQDGDIFNYRDGRYMVKLRTRLPNGRDTISLQPDKVILPVATRVVTCGLSNEQFNDQMAKIVGIDEEALRYTVETQSGKQIKIKLNNVLC